MPHNKAINDVPALRASTGRSEAGALQRRLWRRHASMAQKRRGMYES